MTRAYLSQDIAGKWTLYGRDGLRMTAREFDTWQAAAIFAGYVMGWEVWR